MNKNIILHPTFKLLAIILAVYGFITSALIGVSLFVDNAPKAILGVIALIIGLIFITYIMIGFLTMINDFIHNKEEEGFINRLKKGGRMISFIGVIFSSILNFIYSLVYLATSYATGSRFYLYVSIFFLLVLILKVYLLSSVYEKEENVLIRNYVITSIGAIILSIVMAIIVTLVTFFNSEFSKNGFFLFFNIIFAILKAISAYLSYMRHKRKRSYLRLSLSLIALSLAIFTLFTIHVSILNIFFNNAKMISLIYTGYPFALGMMVIGILSLVNGYKLLKENKYQEIEDSF